MIKETRSIRGVVWYLTASAEFVSSTKVIYCALSAQGRKKIDSLGWLHSFVTSSRIRWYHLKTATAVQPFYILLFKFKRRLKVWKKNFTLRSLLCPKIPLVIVDKKSIPLSLHQKLQRARNLPTYLCLTDNINKLDPYRFIGLRLGPWSS